MRESNNDKLMSIHSWAWSIRRRNGRDHRGRWDQRRADRPENIAKRIRSAGKGTKRPGWSVVCRLLDSAFSRPRNSSSPLKSMLHRNAAMGCQLTDTMVEHQSLPPCPLGQVGMARVDRAARVAKGPKPRSALSAASTPLRGALIALMAATSQSSSSGAAERPWSPQPVPASAQ
jgi:hypothetical protein